MFSLVAPQLVQTGYVKLGYNVELPEHPYNIPLMANPAPSLDQYEDSDDSFFINSPVKSQKFKDHSPEGFGFRSARSEKISEEPKASDSDKSEIASDTIEVHNLPAHLKQDSLWMFLENQKRSGGGMISDLKLDSCKRIAVVQFDSKEGSMMV